MVMSLHLEKPPASLRFRVALVLVICGLAGARARACPFCSAVSLTFAQEIAQSEVAVIAKLVEPSVVHVSTLATMQRRNFAAPYASSGSGWIWDEDGHVVTNAHVVEGAERLQVQLFDGELREAELVGLDLRTDIAVIKVAAGGLHPSRRGSSGDVA